MVKNLSFSRLLLFNYLKYSIISIFYKICAIGMKIAIKQKKSADKPQKGKWKWWENWP